MIQFLRCLKDLRTLSYGNYGIFLIMGNAGFISSTVVQLGYPKMIRVLKMSGEELASVASVEVESVRSLKSHLCAMHGLPTCMQQLLHDGCILDDAAKLHAPQDVQVVFLPVFRARGRGFRARSREASKGLRGAAARGDVETTRLLLEAGVCPNWHVDGCHTALISASDNGHIECVRMLLKAGACTFFRNGDGSTALDCACDRGHVEIVRVLVEAGAARDSWGKVGHTAATALSCACDKGHVEIVRILFEAGVDKDSLGTALMLACYRGHGEIARVLVDAGAQKDLKITFPHVLPSAVANKEVENGDEKAALMYACLSGHVEILFVEAAAKLDSKNRMGFTALIWARRRGEVEIVRVLLDAEVGKDATSSVDSKALMDACLRCHKGDARVLLEAVAGKGLESKLGRTALLWAWASLEAGVDPILRQQGLGLAACRVGRHKQTGCHVGIYSGLNASAADRTGAALTAESCSRRA